LAYDCGCRCNAAVNVFGCGCSSVVEHDLAKVGVEGSSPFARSKISRPMIPDMTGA
jgi:hypothetical protein